MPRRQRLRVCVEPGCPELTTQTRCPQHQLERGRRIEREMGYHDRPWRWVYAHPLWRQLKRRVKREQPYCAVDDCREPTTEIDHIVPLREGGAPFLRSNVQGLCKKHHSEKTAKEVWRNG